MSGYPSKTGNPSGKGRWNNECDDGYDDYEESVAGSDYHICFSPSRYDYYRRERQSEIKFYNLPPPKPSPFERMKVGALVKCKKREEIIGVGKTECEWEHLKKLGQGVIIEKRTDEQYHFPEFKVCWGSEERWHYFEELEMTDG